MDDRTDAFITAGISEEAARQLREATRAIAEKCGISTEEAAERISRAIQGIAQSVKDLCDGLIQIFGKIEKSGIFDIEPRHRRRKRERDRARLIEQRYSAEIRRCERARPFRRVYKPP